MSKHCTNRFITCLSQYYLIRGARSVKKKEEFRHSRRNATRKVFMVSIGGGGSVPVEVMH